MKEDHVNKPCEPGCPSCAALGYDCGGHWRRTPRPANLDGVRGRVTLDVLDEDGDHDAYPGRDT